MQLTVLFPGMPLARMCAGLWRELCDGKLPGRCSKQWYFETFCGVPKEEFESRELEQLDSNTDILVHLDGTVKPYDGRSPLQDSQCPPQCMPALLAESFKRAAAPAVHLPL